MSSWSDRKVEKVPPLTCDRRQVRGQEERSSLTAEQLDGMC